MELAHVRLICHFSHVRFHCIPDDSRSKLLLSVTLRVHLVAASNVSQANALILIGRILALAV